MRGEAAAQGQIVAMVCGAIAGLLAVLAVRDLLREMPGALKWATVAFEPLARAGREGYLPSEPEYRRLVLAGSAFLAALGWMLGGVGVAVLLALAAPWISRRLLRRRRRRYTEQVAKAIPDAANALADSLAAGRSLRGALTELSSFLDGSAAAEFERMGRELELGSPTAAVIADLKGRVPSARVEEFCAALMAGRGAGGDLAALMRRFAAAAAAQDRAARDARSATAQARFTGILVVLMPAAAACFTELVSPGFVGAILGSPPALALVALAGLMQLGGYLAIRRLAASATRPR
jgi:tight adherence protein B